MKVAKALLFHKETPLSYPSKLIPGSFELRVFEIGEVVKISDTGAAQGGNYIPCQAAAQLIVNDHAKPVYDLPDEPKAKQSDDRLKTFLEI